MFTMTQISSYARDRDGERNPTVRSQEFLFTIKPHAGESLLEILRRLERTLKKTEATILKLIIYGPVNVAATTTEVMRRVFSKINWPVTWVEGRACNDAPIAGIQVFAFTGGNVGRLALSGRVVGSVFEDGDARFCLLAGLEPDLIKGTRVEQTERVLDQLQAALAQADFTLGDLVRTWFFLEDLLSWYDAFNEVRARAYSQKVFRSGCLPASTGVAGRNPAGAALTVGVLAMQPLNSCARAVEVPSPLQCPACAYGSRFSRAVEVKSAGLRRLLISGTASIEPDGRTAHVGDVRAQIGLSMQVVDAILESRGMSFGEVTRATAYFKTPADFQIFADWCDQHELRKLPAISTGCDVCRQDLLFEIELDAAQACGAE